MKYSAKKAIKLRKAAGYKTQYSVFSKSGISQGAIVKAETIGIDHEPTGKTLRRMADLYGCKIDDFYAEK